MRTEFVTKRARVVLHDLCLEFGGRDEYPHLSMVTTGNINGRERLVYCKFGHPFFGKDGKNGKLRKKTDSAHGMWIPEWLLVPVTN